MSNTPQLSVIVASYNSRRTIANCIESLRRQVTDRAFEVVVVDSSIDGTGDLVAEQFPEVRLLRFEERKYPGDPRNAGIDVARADILASVDADCEAREDWVEQILEAHRDPSVAIGGAIGNANPASYVGWAAYLCELSQWMPSAPKRWLTDIPTANLSYKKWAFQKYGRFIEGTYGSDTDFNWRLGATATAFCGRPRWSSRTAVSRISGSSSVTSSNMAGIAGGCGWRARSSRH
jgi:glycosyltransferase involved in cell wall biosynthesis